MRKLASVQEITAIEPIPGVDAIARARVLGWWVVVRKGDYKVGDKVVYCEIDSLLPERPEFEFLRASSFKPARVDEAGAVASPAGFRVRTIRFRGQVSQGICFPLAIIGKVSQLSVLDSDAVDVDVTGILGITKWEPAVPVGSTGRIKGPFPGFLSKTDEPCVQTIFSALARYAGHEIYATEKLDGTAFTAFHFHGEFGICSRNYLLDEADKAGHPAQVARDLDLKGKLAKAVALLGRDIAIQGELVGPGIQGNKYKLSAPQLYVFTVVTLDNGNDLGLAAMRGVISYTGLQTVPLHECGVFASDTDVDALVAVAIGHSQLNKTVPREGLVFRSVEPVRDEEIGRLSFKVINPKFLLKYDE